MRLTDRVSQDRSRRIATRAHAMSSQAQPVVQDWQCAKPATPRNSERRDDDRRCNDRTATNDEILVRRIGGFNLEVSLLDVSRRGCRIELIEACDVGDAMIARFPQLESLGSSVRWVSGRLTGIEFQSAIHPAVFDHLLQKLIAAPPVSA